MVDAISKSIKNTNTTPSPFTTTPAPSLTNEKQTNVTQVLQNLPINVTLQLLLNVLKEKQRNPSCNITKEQIGDVTDIIIDSSNNDINTPEQLIDQLQDILNKNYNVADFNATELKGFENLNTDNIWETLFNLAIPRLKNNSKYSTQYAPGWSYVPPTLWETNKHKTPICRNTKEVSGPAFVFGDGVPANALELTEDDNIGSCGAGGVGSMMPKFTYREEGDDWSDGGLTSKDFDADGFSLSKYKKNHALDIDVHNYQANKRLQQEERSKNLQKKMKDSIQKMLKTNAHLF